MDAGAAGNGDGEGPSSAFRIPANGVVHETIDREVIIIQLDRGDYFSLTGSGAEIWKGLAEQQSVGELARSLAERHGLDPVELATTIGSLADQLTAEGLLEPTELGARTDEPGFATAPAGDQPRLGPGPDTDGFQPPVLEKFTDMQDYLLIDPIHEVAVEGWPAKETD